MSSSMDVFMKILFRPIHSDFLCTKFTSDPPYNGTYGLFIKKNSNCAYLDYLPEDLSMASPPLSTSLPTPCTVLQPDSIHIHIINTTAITIFFIFFSPFLIFIESSSLVSPFGICTSFVKVIHSDFSCSKFTSDPPHQHQDDQN